MTDITLSPGRAFFRGLYRALARTELIFAAVAFALLAVLLIAQVVSRYVLAAPLVWTDELARLSMVWMIFVGAAVAAREGTHIALDVVVSRIPERFAWIHVLIVRIFVLVYCGFIGVATVQLIQLQARTTTSVLGLPSGVFSAPLLAFVLLTVLHTVIAITGYHDEALDPPVPWDALTDIVEVEAAQAAAAAGSGADTTPTGASAAQTDDTEPESGGPEPTDLDDPHSGTDQTNGKA